MKRYVVIMGPPGAGKGTQAKKLAAALGLPHVATGDLFRANLIPGEETDLGMQVKAFMDAGELVPDTVTADMLHARLLCEDAVNGAILDGFPRTMDQVFLLDEMLETLNGHIACVLQIDVPDEVLLARLLERAQIEGRTDDNEEVIANRLVVYAQQTDPVVRYYRKMPAIKHFTINGAGTITEVYVLLQTTVNSVFRGTYA